MTLDEMATWAKEYVAALSSDVRPDDAWLPQLFTWGKENLRITLLDTWQGTDPLGKKLTFEIVIPYIIRDDLATMACFTSTAWVSQQHPRPGETPQQARDRFRAAGMQPKDDPNRREQQLLLLADASHSLGYIAEVTRHPGQHPTLGEWKQSDLASGIVEEIQRAIREVTAESN